MQKIGFVSIILLIGLFSLQLTLANPVRSYYKADEPVPLKPVIYNIPLPSSPDLEYRTDSTDLKHMDHEATIKL